MRRDAGPKARFLFSLAKEDTVRLSGDRAGIWVVKKIKASTEIVLVQQHDARKEGATDQSRVEFRPRPSGIMKYSAEKVSILPIGDVVQCHD